jgi:cobalt-zinc-cadmium efflux system outer membrane protein
MLAAVLALALCAPPQPTIAFDEALSLAERSPRSAAATVAVAKRREVTKRLSSLDSNPSLAVQPGLRTGPLGQGFELYGTLSHNFNVSGFQGARREALERELAHEEAQARATKHDQRLLAARAWLALWAAQAALAEARRELDLASEWWARVSRSGTAGAMTKVDVASARAYRAEAELGVLALEGERFEAGIWFSRVLGLSLDEPALVSPGLPDLPLPDDALLRRSVASASRAPHAQVAAQLRDAELARANEAVAAKGWWMQAGASTMREGFGDFVLQGTVQVTFPLFDRGEREQAPLVAAAARADGEQRAAVADAHAERVRAIHELEHTSETLKVLEEELVPATEEAAAGEQRRLEGGEATAQEWVLARRAAVAAKGRRVRAQADHAFARFHAAELAAAVVVAGGAP